MKPAAFHAVDCTSSDRSKLRIQEVRGNSQPTASRDERRSPQMSLEIPPDDHLCANLMYHRVRKLAAEGS